MITKKQVSKLQLAAIKQTAENLAGAAKLYAAIFANCSDLKALCKTLEIPVECAAKVSTLAKDKNKVVTICSQMLPKVNGTFARFTLYQKEYYSNEENAAKGIPAKGDQWLKDNALVGKEFKPFGFATPTKEKVDALTGRVWLVKKTENYRAEYVATKQATFSVRLVAKCISEYISHESNQS